MAKVIEFKPPNTAIVRKLGEGQFHVYTSLNKDGLPVAHFECLDKIENISRRLELNATETKRLIESIVTSRIFGKLLEAAMDKLEGQK